jgi:hypothetical protein
MAREKVEISYEEKANRVITYFNQRFQEVLEVYDRTSFRDRIVGDSRGMGRPQLSRNFYSPDKGKYEILFSANGRQDSPNRVRVNLSFEFGAGVCDKNQFRKDESEEVPSFNLIKKGLKLNVSSRPYNGKIYVGRHFGAGDDTILSANFGPKSSGSTFDGWNDLYLYSPVVVGKRHLDLIEAVRMKKQLERLVFEERVNVRRAIDFAFKLFTKPEVRVKYDP